MELSSWIIYRNSIPYNIVCYKDGSQEKYSRDVRDTTRAYFKMNELWDSAWNYVITSKWEFNSLWRWYNKNNTTNWVVSYHKAVYPKFISLWFMWWWEITWKHMQLPLVYYWWITYNYDHSNPLSKQSFQYHITWSWPKTYVTTNPNTWYYTAYWVTEDNEMFFYLNDQRTSMWQLPEDALNDKAVFTTAQNPDYYLYLSDVLAEETARSDQEIITYFNNTKSLYWY